jgi:hypothetical protein
VDGFRRESSSEDKYSFIFPDSWVIDQSVYLNRVRNNELPLSLRDQRRSASVKPEVAYGPMQGDGRENLSVIKSSVMPGFSLEMMGTPQVVAERLLSTVIAPPQSGGYYVSVMQDL